MGQLLLTFRIKADLDEQYLDGFNSLGRWMCLSIYALFCLNVINLLRVTLREDTRGGSICLLRATGRIRTSGRENIANAWQPRSKILYKVPYQHSSIRRPSLMMLSTFSTVAPELLQNGGFDRRCREDRM